MFVKKFKRGEKLLLFGENFIGLLSSKIETAPPDPPNANSIRPSPLPAVEREDRISKRISDIYNVCTVLCNGVLYCVWEPPEGKPKGRKALAILAWDSPCEITLNRHLMVPRLRGSIGPTCGVLIGFFRKWMPCEWTLHLNEWLPCEWTLCTLLVRMHGMGRVRLPENASNPTP